MSTGGADPPPLLVVISGPSGVGKDAVIAEMRASQPGITFAVTATTRPMRAGEVDGRDYVFLSTKRFEAMLAEDGFLEHAEVYGNRYGVPRQGVRAALAAGRDVIVKIDVQGAATIREIAPDALLIFLAAPSAAELERRLRARKTDSPEQLTVRIKTAQHETQQASWFDVTIVNETGAVGQTVARIIETIEEQRRRVPARRVVV